MIMKYIIQRPDIHLPCERTLARRRLYKADRLDAFLGVNVTPQMNEEIEREAARALRPKSEFLRMLLEEGLKSLRFQHLRIVKRV